MRVNKIYPNLINKAILITETYEMEQQLHESAHFSFVSAVFAEKLALIEKCFIVVH